MSLDPDQQALDLINAWEAGEYLHPAQKKAALQVAIRDALAQARAEAAEKALALLVADVADYPAWQRPCHALDVARAHLAKHAGGNNG